MGNTEQNPHIRVFANSGVWMEDTAIQQLHTTATNLPGIQAAVGLPDLHPGRGYPVGAAFFSTGHLYPALVGGDIGCGMQLLATGLTAHKESAEKLQKKLGNIDGPLDVTELDDSTLEQLKEIARQAGVMDLQRLLDMLGTIGGGNHFAEIQAVDELYEPEALDSNKLHLLVHSGSRGLGGEILRRHIEQHGHAGLSCGSAAAELYLQQHAAAIAFAALNRQHIAARILQRLRTTSSTLLDVMHNHVIPYQWQGQNGYLHRKGATPADTGWVVIPGSRGDYSYLVRPLADTTEALDSLAHGAGRKWARKDCKGRLKPRFNLQQLQKSRFGSALVCADRELLYEEAPQAYKGITPVMDTLCEAGLIKLVARLRPVLTYKKGGSQC